MMVDVIHSLAYTLIAPLDATIALPGLLRAVDVTVWTGASLVYHSAHFQTGGNPNGNDLYANGKGSKGRGSWFQSLRGTVRWTQDFGQVAKIGSCS